MKKYDRINRFVLKLIAFLYFVGWLLSSLNESGEAEKALSAFG